MKKRRLVFGTFGVMAAIAAVLYGCDDDKPSPAGPGSTLSPEAGGKDNAVADQKNPVPETGTDSSMRYTAHADIRATFDGSAANGTATFTEENGEVTVVVDMATGFPPGGPGARGMHIHQNGSCSANDSGVGGAIVNAGAAGPHWNPTDAGHGYPSAAVHHAGDMGNIAIGDSGTGKLTLSKEWTVRPGDKSVVGHAVIFHVQADDGTSQPVGDAGSRPGCGVIVTP